MLLFAGLGNPGPRHADNRHNVGFLVLDAIHRRHGLGPWRSTFGDSLTIRADIADRDILLLKPTNYMNESGLAVRTALKFYDLPLSNLIVVHDEIERWPATVKLKIGGGSAGHNGLRSITKYCGNDYTRLQIGVGRPTGNRTVDSYLLSDFDQEEMHWVTAVCEAIANSFDRVWTKPEEFLRQVHIELSEEGISQRTGRPPKK